MLLTEFLRVFDVSSTIYIQHLYIDRINYKGKIKEFTFGSSLLPSEDYNYLLICRVKEVRLVFDDLFIFVY